MKRILALVLALCMTFALCACGTTAPAAPAAEAPAAEEPAAEAPAAEEPAAEVEAADVEEAEDDEIEVDPYTLASEEKYEEILGDFYAEYMKAKESDNISERYALMALAEGKLMESAVMLPTTTRGGLYAISRVAPYSVSTVLWGNDSDRFHDALVTVDPITSEDRAELKAMYAELVGTGTWAEAEKQFLLDKGYELKDVYNYAYTSDPDTWDILSSSRATVGEALVNTFDGLYEYDTEIALQPALATSYESKINEDGTETYTFTLRQGVKWVDSQGREVAEVTADDFVAGMQHMMDAQGGLEYLVCSAAAGGCGIQGADAYVYGETDDFSTVGVKALDDYTVEYTLDAHCPYFMTMLGYSIFAPMNRAYYESKGGAFGLDGWNADPNYSYGLTPDDIAYCGPYIVTNLTAESMIVFSANENYWNKDNINIHTINWFFSDGTDVTKPYNDMKAGDLEGCNLSDTTLKLAREDGMFDQYAYTSLTDATSYMGFINVNRALFANVNDDTAVISAQSEEDAARTNAALNNVHFRRALCFAADRGAANAVFAGEELKYNALRNCYTPGTFVLLEEEATVEINGTATTFPAGTFYGEIMQAQIDADGVAMKVWDNENLTSDGFDGWYSPENAMAELALAAEELAAEGVEISAENPIIIDWPCPMNSDNYVLEKNTYKQSIEAATEGMIIVNLTECVDYDQWYYCGYYTDYGYEANYDIYDLSGWGPDYGDPATYLDTMLPDYSGYMVKCLGIF